MKKPQGAATSTRTPAAAAAAGTTLSSGRAFGLNACFVAGACGLGFSAGCENTVAMIKGDKFRRDAPTLADYGFILRGSKGPLADREPAQLYARACIQGWSGTCGTQ